MAEYTDKVAQRLAAKAAEKRSSNSAKIQDAVQAKLGDLDVAERSLEVTDRKREYQNRWTEQDEQRAKQEAERAEAERIVRRDAALDKASLIPIIAGVLAAWAGQILVFSAIFAGAIQAAMAALGATPAPGSDAVDIGTVGMVGAVAAAVVAATAIEAVALSMGRDAQRAREAGDHAGVERTVLWACVAWAGVSSFVHLGDVSVAAFSLLGVGTWEVRERRRWRNAAIDALPPRRPRFGVARWFAFWAETSDARKVAIRDRLTDPQVAIERARAERADREEQRNRAKKEIVDAKNGAAVPTPTLTPTPTPVPSVRVDRPVSPSPRPTLGVADFAAAFGLTLSDRDEAVDRSSRPDGPTEPTASVPPRPTPSPVRIAAARQSLDELIEALEEHANTAGLADGQRITEDWVQQASREVRGSGMKATRARQIRDELNARRAA